MEKINVVILSDDMDLRIDIKNLLRKDRFAVSGYSGFGAAAKTKIINLFPDMVLCAIRGKAREDIFVFVQDLLSTIRGTMVVLTSDILDVDVVNTAAAISARAIPIPLCTSAVICTSPEISYRNAPFMLPETYTSAAISVRCGVCRFTSAVSCMQAAIFRCRGHRP